MNNLNARQKMFTVLSRINFQLNGLNMSFKVDKGIMIYAKSVEAMLNTLPDEIDEKNEHRFMIADEKINTLLMLLESYLFNLRSV